MRGSLFLACVLSACCVSAATVVRTAYHFTPGICERKPDGTVRGLVPDYLVRIARINDWQIEPVYCTYDEALAKLAKGEIDLVGGVTPTPDRRKAFRFATYATGEYRPHLFVRPNSPCSPGQVGTWKDLEIALGPGAQSRRLLTDVLRSCGASCRFRTYRSASAAASAFLKGETPAVYTLGTEAFKSSKVLKSFPAVPCYFCTPLAATNLGERLDRAILQLQVERPDFEDRLLERHFPVKPRREVSLTDEESRWLRNRVRSRLPIVVDLSPECPPFKWFDRETGKPAGFVRLLLDEIARRTGLSFAYLPPTTEARARTRFLRQEADLWASYGAKADDLPGLRAGIVVSEFTPILVSRKGEMPENLDNALIGVPAHDRGLQTAYRRAGLTRIKAFESSGDAMDALLKGRIDALTMTFSVALLQRKEHDAEEQLEFHPLSARVPWSVAFRLFPSNTADPCLTSVIRKSIDSFSKIETLSLLYRSLGESGGKPILSDREWMMVIIGTLAFALVVVAGVFLFYNRRLSNALMRAQAGERSRAQFLATVSHEIRTPLNAVVGFAEFLRLPQLSQADVAGYADGIGRASRVLLDLINDVLDFARLESGRADLREGVLDLRRLAEDLRQIFARKAQEKGVDLRFALEGEFSGLRLSPYSIRQLLLNLVGNAVKFTSSGSVVTTVSLAETHQPEAVDLTIEVADTGVGMSAETLPTIFDPFVQDIASRGGRIYEGTGLGLPIVKRIVEALGGTVGVTSEPGKGTTFTVRIPNVVRAALPRETPPDAPAPSAALPRSVVVVDDVPMNVRILALHLKNLGVGDVRTAASGEEALQLVSERAPEVVLTDMWMPGMDGAELAKRLRQEAPGVRVFAVTADADSEKSFDLSPFAAVVTKPVTREKLLAAIACPQDPAPAF